VVDIVTGDVVTVLQKISNFLCLKRKLITKVPFFNLLKPLWVVTRQIEKSYYKVLKVIKQ
jgi:hypothetical protein